MDTHFHNEDSMTVFDTTHQRAAWLVAILGVIILVALVPYASGLLGAPILYVLLGPMHTWLVPRVRSRAVASGLTILAAMVGIVLPLIWMISLLVGQAQGAVASILASPLLGQLDSISIGPYKIGPQIKEAGTQAVSMIGGSAFTLLGKATSITLNLLFTFFGLYYLLMDPQGAWHALRAYIPFSDANVEILKSRFEAVTKSTVIGTGLSALVQGTLITVGFAVAGLGNPVFWGAVTFVVSIMPVVGSGLVWGPAAILLFATHRPIPAVGMIIYGAVLVGNVDNLIRPWVTNRYAQIHPLITLVGAVAGVSYVGLLGLLLGPLALTYFFEVLKMYRREYLNRDSELVMGT